MPWPLLERTCENRVKKGKLRSGALFLEYKEEQNLKSEYSVRVG